MIEELFAAVKEDQSYHMVLTEVRKGLPKEAVKLLTPDHPAWAMVQQRGEIGEMRRWQDSLMVYQGTRIVVPAAARKKSKEFCTCLIWAKSLRIRRGP